MVAANLEGANATDANLHGADLTGASLENVDLSTADTSRAVIIDPRRARVVPRIIPVHRRFDIIRGRPIAGLSGHLKSRLAVWLSIRLPQVPCDTVSRTRLLLVNFPRYAYMDDESETYIPRR